MTDHGQETPFTPEQEAELDRLLSDGRLNAYMARQAVLGYNEASMVYDLDAADGFDPHVGEESQDEPPLHDPHHRVSSHTTKPGHVRDFADGGRADEYRIDYFGEPQSETARQAREAALPNLQDTTDDIAQVRLMKLLEEGYTHTEIQALWQKHLDRRQKPQAETDDKES
jgi:hypothetical protein